MTKPEQKNSADSGQSDSNAGLGTINKMREWAQWYRTEGQDGIALILENGALDIENLRAALNAMMDLDRTFRLCKAQHVEELAAEGSEIAAAVLLSRRALHIHDAGPTVAQKET